MAKITLFGKGNQVTDELPPACILCGETSCVTKGSYFTWTPGWVYWFLLLGVLPGIILWNITQKTMHVPLPLCRRHRFPWLSQTVTACAFCLFFFGGVLGSRYLSSDADGPPASYIVTWAALVVGALVAHLFSAAPSFRPTEITNVSITLDGVSQLFVQKMEEMELRKREFDTGLLPKNRIRSTSDDTRFTT